MEKKKEASEKAIEKAILFWLNCQDGMDAWKNNTTGIYDKKKQIYRKNKGKYSSVGTSDVIGNWYGRKIAFEVKKNSKSKASKDQKKYVKKVQKNGGIAAIVWTVEQVVEIIKEERELTMLLKGVVDKYKGK